MRAIYNIELIPSSILKSDTLVAIGPISSRAVIVFRARTERDVRERDQKNVLTSRGAEFSSSCHVARGWWPNRKSEKDRTKKNNKQTNKLKPNRIMRTKRFRELAGRELITLSARTLRDAKCRFREGL